MYDLFNKVVGRLIESGALPETAQETACPAEPSQIIPKLIDLGVAPQQLTRTISELFNWPVYSAIQYGEFEYADPNKQWAYVGGVLFLACPFDNSMQAAALLPADAYADFHTIGLLPVSNKDGDDADVAEAERIIKTWLTQAIKNNASDVHIIPLTPKYIRVRARINGQLQTLEEVPAQRGNMSYRFVSNMLLSMAGCQTGSFTKPLDGRFECELENGVIEVRLSMRPVAVHNEPCQAFFLRLQGGGESQTLNSLDSLGLPSWSHTFFARLRHKNQGLILMSGPTGSGKSSTLYANLARIVCDSPWRSVQTLEDPVERHIEGVAQTQINANVGMGFHDGLRALMRSDVDVVLIGEVRDDDTAKLAVRAGLTGQLVFGTVHAKSALLSIERMIDLGVSAKSLAAVLVAVVSQRLLRRVCEQCSTTMPFCEHSYYETYKNLLADDCPIKVANLKGCSQCQYGYRDRVVAIEGVNIEKKLSMVIAADGDITELESAAGEQFHSNFWYSAQELLTKGVTTLEECDFHLPPYKQGAISTIHQFKERKYDEKLQHTTNLRKVAEEKTTRLLNP